MKSSAPRQITANSSTVPHVTVSAVRFRPQPYPSKIACSVGRSVVKAWLRWLDFRLAVNLLRQTIVWGRVLSLFAKGALWRL
jgi:hypothetical protein